MAGSRCRSGRSASQGPGGVRSSAESSKLIGLFYQYFQRGTSRCSKANDGMAPGVTTTRTQPTSGDPGTSKPRDDTSHRYAQLFGDSESALVLQPVLDLGEPLFTGPQRGGAGMHRVAAEHETM